MTVEIQDASERLAAILEKVGKLGPALRERALAAERASRLSDETIADLDATGAFNIGSPAEFGGDELSVRQQLDVVSEVSKWDGSCGWTVWVGASTNWIPAGSGARVVEEVYGPEWVGPRVSGSSHFPGLPRPREARRGRLDHFRWSLDLRQRLAVGPLHQPRLHRQRRGRTLSRGCPGSARRAPVPRRLAGRRHARHRQRFHQAGRRRALRARLPRRRLPRHCRRIARQRP